MTKYESIVVNILIFHGKCSQNTYKSIWLALQSGLLKEMLDRRVKVQTKTLS